VAYQTAYLKAHYPSEYMAAVMSNNQGNLEKITFFMEESRKMGIPVLGPDVNESNIRFAANKKGEIRYALSAIKGVGEAAVESIVEERKLNGPYQSIFDFAKRVNLRTVNKKSLESLAYAGAFDSFQQYSRATFILPDPKDGMNLIEKMIRYGNNEQSAKTMNQNSLFGESISVEMSEPAVSKQEEYPLLEKLKYEKEVVGIYISGHPLDDYKLEIENFTNCSLKNIPEVKDKDLKIAGIISKTITKVSKTGNQYVSFTLEDFEGTFEFALFGKDYIQFKNFAETLGAMVYINGRYQPRYNQPDNFEFKILKIELLSEVRDKVSKNITVTIDAATLSERIIDEMKLIFEQHPGKLPVYMKLKHEGEEIVLNVYSRKFMVNPVNEVFKALHALEEVDVKLN
jgi:DNA polymerase-3 subunit alpha